MAAKNPKWPPGNLGFFYISTSDRGDFPRIIEIALFNFVPYFMVGIVDSSIPDQPIFLFFFCIRMFILEKKFG